MGDDEKMEGEDPSDEAVVKKKNKEPKDTSDGETDFSEEISKNSGDMAVEITESSQDTLEASKKKDKVPEEEVKEESSSTDQEDSSQKKKKKKKTKKSKKDKNDE